MSKLIDANFERLQKQLYFYFDLQRKYDGYENNYTRLGNFGKFSGITFGEEICSTDYIVAFEPQGRGAWHAHACVFQNKKKKRFIRSETLAKDLENGFVKIGKDQRFGFIE